MIRVYVYVSVCLEELIRSLVLSHNLLWLLAHTHTHTHTLIHAISRSLPLAQKKWQIATLNTEHKEWDQSKRRNKAEK